MKRFKGFKLRSKLVKVFKWTIRPRRKPTRFHLLDPNTRSYNPMAKIFKLARHIQRGAKGLCFPNSDPGYIQLGQVEANKPAMGVPKGHLAVYVGQSADDTKRVLVPVIYFNHPLFVELLKEAERVYGFDQPGGITIPCGISDFERVQMRIAAGDHCRHRCRRGSLPAS